MMIYLPLLYLSCILLLSQFVVIFLSVSLMTPSCLSVLSVWPSNIALQCPQIQIHHYHVGLWAGHHLSPELPAPSSGAQVSH